MQHDEATCAVRSVIAEFSLEESSERSAPKRTGADTPPPPGPQRQASRSPFRCENSAILPLFGEHNDLSPSTTRSIRPMQVQIDPSSLTSWNGTAEPSVLKEPLPLELTSYLSPSGVCVICLEGSAAFPQADRVSTRDRGLRPSRPYHRSAGLCVMLPVRLLALKNRGQDTPQMNGARIVDVAHGQRSLE